MKCKVCKKELNREWKFCPNCGESIKFFKMNFPNLFSRKEKEDDFNNIEKEMEHMLNSFGFPNIKISFRTHNGPQIQQEISKPSTKQIEPKRTSERKVDSVEEPEAKIKHTQKEIQIEMITPGVLSVNDVFIRKFGESIEVRAYAGKKMYFKVIPVNQKSEILKKLIENNTLKIVLSRQF